MKNESPESLAKSAPCVWCASQYAPAYSRARTQALFCSTKCEVEARFWLVAKLEVSKTSGQ